MPSIHAAGKHQVILDEDVFSIQYFGDISLAEFQQMVALLRQHRESIAPRPQYSISDVAQMGNLSAEGRRLMLDWFKENPVEVLLFHGAGLAARTVVRMFVSASRLVYGRELRAVFV